jgi:hypothetical protein
MLLHISMRCDLWRSWLRHCSTRQVPVSIPVNVLGNFQVTYSFRSHKLVLGIPSAPNRNEHQGISLGVGYGRCVELIILPS